MNTSKDETLPILSNAEKLHIAYFINQYPKVSHSFIRREIRALEQQGVKVDRYALRGWDAEVVDKEDIQEQEQTQYVLKNGLFPLAKITLVTLFSRPGKFFQTLKAAVGMSWRSERSLPYHLIYLAHACQILSWVKTSRATHIHAHFATNSAEITMLVRLLGGPQYSFTMHGPEEFDKIHNIGIQKKVRHAKFVAAISSYTQSQMFRFLDLTEWPKIKPVHCGLDRDFYQIPQSSPPPERQRLVCVGRLCEQKAQIILLEALSLVVKSGGKCELVLAGDGEMRPQVEERINALGLKSHVRITGWISSEQVRSEISAARALVLPSFQEGLPVVIMEAMALKRPVISTYIAGIPELVQDGKTGWLVPAGNVNKLAAAMKACLSAPLDELTQMGKNAHTRVIQRHDIDKEASRLIQLFGPSPIKNVIEEWKS